MEAEDQMSPSQSMNIESGFIGSEDQLPRPKATPASAHITGTDGWKQVGLMLVTSFNCGFILSYSNLIMVPLGWAWGIPTMFLGALFVAYANWLLAGFHFIQGHRFIRYRDIMGFLFGRQMYYLTGISQFTMFFLSNMSFILFGGRVLKEMNSVFSEAPLRLQYLIVITGVAYFIFSFVVPNMSAMKMWLGASVFLTFTYIIFILVETIKDGKLERHREYKVRGSKTEKLFNALSAISTIVFCNSSGMVLEIQSTLKEPTVKNMRKAIAALFTAGPVMYYGITIVGYWAYGSQVSDYLPEEFSRRPKWARILINATVFLQSIITQHMFAQPIHEAADTKFLRLDKGIYSIENLGHRFFLRALLFTVTTFVAATLPFIGDFIGVLGSLILIPLTFVFPSMIFLKVKEKTVAPKHRAWHWVIIFVCSFLTVVTTVSSLRSIGKHISEYNLFADI